MSSASAMEYELEKLRPALLEMAVADVKKWCGLDEQKPLNRPPDTRWIELFGYGNTDPITDDHVRIFLSTFQLTIHVKWNRLDVAEIIAGVRRDSLFDPLVGVAATAERLRTCNKRNTRQTSAASKIATFAKPNLKVFIWDSLATRSVRHREWMRHPAGRSRPSSALYLSKTGQHDYVSYYEACDRALEDELAQPDFQKAISLLDEHFRAQGGVMSDRSKVPRAFIERRLLDKLMFWEGHKMRGPRMSRSALI
jgi:hypothetical protein